MIFSDIILTQNFILIPYIITTQKLGLGIRALLYKKQLKKNNIFNNLQIKYIQINGLHFQI